MLLNFHYRQSQIFPFLTYRAGRAYPHRFVGGAQERPWQEPISLMDKKISLLAFVSQQGYLLIQVSGSPWLTVLHLYNSHIWASSSDSSATASSTFSSVMQKTLGMAATGPGMAHNISFRWWQYRDCTREADWRTRRWRLLRHFQ